MQAGTRKVFSRLPIQLERDLILGDPIRHATLHFFSLNGEDGRCAVEAQINAAFPKSIGTWAEVKRDLFQCLLKDVVGFCDVRLRDEFTGYFTCPAGVRDAAVFEVSGDVVDLSLIHI